ncbi:MAG: hypothetical protein FWE19_08220 [Oscillospiraceae bacterium]|nr:hypothetical protein [Oscillospiraceae bacterium]
MDTLLENMDHAAGQDGHPVTITGARAAAQRLLIRLSVRAGSFAPDPGLGSRLHKLSPALAGPERDRLALHYAQEALLPEGAKVCSARTRPIRGKSEALAISLQVSLGGERFPLEVAI